MSTHGTITDHLFSFEVERSKNWEDRIPKKSDPWDWKLRVEIGGFELELSWQRWKRKRTLWKKQYWKAYDMNVLKRDCKTMMFTPFGELYFNWDVGPWFHRDSGDYRRESHDGKFPH